MKKFGQGALWLVVVSVFLAFCMAPSSQAGRRGTTANADKADGVDVSGLLESARHLFDEGQYGAVITKLESAQSEYPTSAAICFWMGRTFFEIRDFDRSILELKKAVSLDGKISAYHQWLGRAYGGKADKEKSFFVARNAKGQFEAAVKLDPSNVAARRDLADYCMQAPWIVGGSKDEALTQVNAIAAIDPVEGHLARAEYDLNILKDPTKAADEYRAALAAKPKAVKPYLEVAAFFGHQNQLPEMKSAIDAVTATHPNDPRVTFYHGVFGVLSKTNLEGAEENIKSYLASTPERSDWPSHSSARDWLGRLYEEQGKGVKAAEQYRAALQMDPQNQDAQERLKQLESAVQ